MKSNMRLKNIDPGLSISLIIYVVLAIILLPRYQYQVNPDGVSYIGIAQKYMRLDFANAVNGFWGPMLSWLLIPFLKLGTAPLLSAKFLSLSVGLVVLWQSHVFFKILNIEGHSRKVLMVLMAVVALYFALSVITPDILIVCFILAYFNIIFRQGYSSSKLAGVWSGIFGALLYLTKSYGFPFFVVHFLVFNLIFFFTTKEKTARKRIGINYISGMVVFVFISFFWVFTISQKYGHFTLGTAGSYNHTLIGPQSLGHPLGHPMHIMGFLAPSNSSAISVWEDISNVEFPGWELFGSFDNVMFQVKTILANWVEIFTILEKFSFLSVVILIAAWFYLRKKRKLFVSNPVFLLIISLFILVAGYSTLLIVNRYIWLGIIILLAMGAKLLDEFEAQRKIKYKSKLIMTYILAASFLILPARNLYMNLDFGVQFYNFSKAISKFGIEGRVASNIYWHETLYVSFYNNWKYYGEIGKETKIKEGLDKNEIDYLLVWDRDNQRLKFVEQYEEITKGAIRGLRVYKLR